MKEREGGRPLPGIKNKHACLRGKGEVVQPASFAQTSFAAAFGEGLKGEEKYSRTLRPSAVTWGGEIGGREGGGTTARPLQETANIPPPPLFSLLQSSSLLFFGHFLSEK